MQEEFIIADGTLVQYTGQAHSIVIPAGVRAIGKNVFKGMAWITEITLPDGLKEIGEGAFKGCRQLAEIRFPDSLQSIGDFAFHRCHALVSAELPDAVTSLGAGVFHYCDRLKTFRANGVRRIGKQTFTNDTALTALSFHSEIDCTNFSDDIFTGCSAIREIRLSDGFCYRTDNLFADYISGKTAHPVVSAVAAGLYQSLEAKNGVLYKTAASLEAVGRANIVALDKTGTITEGKPNVTDIIPYGITETELLIYASALEAKSEHPLAKAVIEKTTGMKIPEVDDFKALAGNGLSAMLNGEFLEGGSYIYISQKYELPSDFTAKVTALSDEGKTPLLFAKGGKFIGIIAVADTIKSDSAEAIKELKGMGINVYMLTGDNERTANAIGKQADVDNVIAGVLPDGKSKKVSELKKQGKVIMVGDGINDAPALTTADTGVAIGAGADVAIDAADIVVMKNRLTDVSAAIRLSRATIKNIHENLFWAFIYNAVCIPLAIGLYGVEMKPAYGAAAMAMSSFCVCMNALRLNLVRIHDASHDKKIKTKIIKTEEKAMTKTLKIEGMMCEHCEARVKKTLEAIDGIESAAPDHNNDTAVITLSKDVSVDVIKAAIEAQDYTFIGEV